ncbi:MAG: apolipoprotein N-acyltransferase [Clostridia bacterium]|nr:apolipoprotein N-acyltransferase [Clostridia bacterium]
MKKRKSWWGPIFIACGALTSLTFMVGELWFLAWFTLSPMIYYLIRNAENIRVRRAFGIGATFGIGYYGMMYHWFINFYPMDFAGLNETESIGVIALCWIGLATMHSLELGAVTMVYRLIKPKKRCLPLCITVFTACWATFEWTQTLGWRGVPWGRLALSQWKALPLIQSASLFGGIFVSALIVAVNSLIAAAVIEIQKHRTDIASATEGNDTTEEEKISAPSYKKIGFPDKLRDTFNAVILAFSAKKSLRVYALVAVGIVAANTLFGVIRMAAYNEKSGEGITAAVIQGNISSLDKWADSSVTNSTKTHLDLTRKCVEETGAKLVLWAETAIPAAIDKYPTFKQRISDTAKELGIVLVIGAFEYKYNQDTQQKDTYNALITFLPDGTEVDTRYYKRHLVPFAESLPMENFIRTFLPVLVELNLISDPLAQGDSANIMKTDLGAIGGIICYDSIFPALSMDAVREGAEIIAISTNDSWFSDSAAIYQHNRQAVFRAIETGRYVVRSANTGISSIITPEGKFLAETEPLVDCYASATVYMRSDSTLYACIGDTFVYLCLGYVAVMLGFSVYKAIYKKRHPMYSEP